jgi:hypothetical protein
MTYSSTSSHIRSHTLEHFSGPVCHALHDREYFTGSFFDIFQMDPGMSTPQYLCRQGAQNSNGHPCEGPRISTRLLFHPSGGPWTLPKIAVSLLRGPEARRRIISRWCPCEGPGTASWVCPLPCHGPLLFGSEQRSSSTKQGCDHSHYN